MVFKCCHSEGVKGTPHAVERARLLQIANNEQEIGEQLFTNRERSMCQYLVYLVPKSKGVYRLFVHRGGTERGRLCVAIVCFRRSPKRADKNLKLNVCKLNVFFEVIL
jgi:hypothetical protein